MSATIAATGQMRAENASALLGQWEHTLSTLSTGAVMTLDLSGLQSFDSSALAALLAMARRARARGVTLACVNAPANLRKLAALYGVDTILFGD